MHTHTAEHGAAAGRMCITNRMSYNIRFWVFNTQRFILGFLWFVERYVLTTEKITCDNTKELFSSFPWEFCRRQIIELEIDIKLLARVKNNKFVTISDGEKTPKSTHLSLS